MHHIPIFPDFKKLDLEDKKSFYDFTNNYPPYSDFNFISILSYDIEEDTLISNLNNNLVIRLRDYITNDYVYSFLGNNKPSDTINELFGFIEAKRLKPELKLIPESNIEHQIHALHKDFNIEEDRDSFDYIFSLIDISKLPGKKFSSKRNKLNNFLKLYPNAVTDTINLSDNANHEHLLYVFSHWAKKRTEEETAHEFKAVKRLLQFAAHLNLVCFGVFINQKLEAFTIVEPLEKSFIIAHYTKADSKFVGIFEYLYQQMATEMHKKGYAYYNREQDLGLEGLRAAKLSWRPTHFLKKYTISKKSTN